MGPRAPPFASPTAASSTPGASTEQPVEQQTPFAPPESEWPFETAYRAGIIPRMQLEASRFFREAGQAFLRRIADEWPPPARKQADADVEAWLKQLLADPNLSAERLADALQPYIEQALAAGAASADRRTAPSARISWDLRNPEAVRWLKRWRIPFRRQVDETTHREILRRLVAGIDRGAPFEEIAADLRSLFGAWERWRAELVAHTEGVRALSEGQLIYWGSARVTTVRYVTAQDELTCPICLPLHGREMRIEDARGFIPRHPRCRCYWEPVRRAERRPPRRTTPPMVGAVPQAPPLAQPAVRVWDESRLRSGEEAEAALDRLLELAAEDMERRFDGLRVRGELRFGGAVLTIELDGEREDLPLRFEVRDLGEAKLQQWIKAFNAERTLLGQWRRLEQLARMTFGKRERQAQALLESLRLRLARFAPLRIRVEEAILESGRPEGARPWPLADLVDPQLAPDVAAHFRQMGRAAADWLDRFVRGPLAQVEPLRGVGQSADRRAFYSGQQKAIYVHPSNGISVWVHEVGHHLHWGSQTAMSLVHVWFMRRAGSEEPSLIYPDKDAHKPPQEQERGVRDKFLQHYVGEVYPWEPSRGTEVVSMGLEYFAASPLDILLGDPDHARLIWGLAKGVGADG